MTLRLPTAGLAEEDFDAIHAAVLETSRGRLFLAEYGRRTRAEDTERLLAAMRRLEDALLSNPESGAARLRGLGSIEADAADAEARAVLRTGSDAGGVRPAWPDSVPVERLDVFDRFDVLSEEERLNLFS